MTHASTPVPEVPPMPMSAPQAVSFAEAFRFWLMHRTWGGIVAGALFVLPSMYFLIATWLVPLLR